MPSGLMTAGFARLVGYCGPASMSWGPPFCGCPSKMGPVGCWFGVCIRAPDFGRLPNN